MCALAGSTAPGRSRYGVHLPSHDHKNPGDRTTFFASFTENENTPCSSSSFFSTSLPYLLLSHIQRTRRYQNKLQIKELNKSDKNVDCKSGRGNCELFGSHRRPIWSNQVLTEILCTVQNVVPTWCTALCLQVFLNLYMTIRDSATFAFAAFVHTALHTFP